MDEQLRREFLAEAEDLIEGLYGDLALLRARRGEGRARRELVGRIFRRVHTVKGTASAAGLEAVSRLAHEFETLLDAVRMGRVGVDDAVLEASEEIVGAVAGSLGAAARGERASEPHELVTRLRRLASAVESNAPPPGGTIDDAEELLPRGLAGSLNEYERRRLRESVREGARTYVVTVDFDLATFDEQFRRLSEALGGACEIISTQPGMDASTPGCVRFSVVLTTGEGREGLAARVAAFGARVSEDEKVLALAASAHAGEGEEGAALPASAVSRAAHVRVPLGELDELISAARELSADTSGALDLALAGEAERAELELRVLNIRRRFFELEQRLFKLRVVPLLAALERAARAGEAVARAAGKAVEFEIAGGDVRLDRWLAERLAEPLLHLLRNAVDHGVEPPAERRAAGKHERGRVRLEAVAGSGRVTLRVSDDGRGVDPERVAPAAAARGLVAPGTRLTEEHALRLIFRPGFSTATELTPLSGRGVGLEVVQRAVEEAGGEVGVRSERGRGTTFELRLPKPLARDPPRPPEIK
jgi:two-component system chemotaxis sensor kinase CheA